MRDLSIVEVEAVRIESEAVVFEDKKWIEIFRRSDAKCRLETAFEVTATMAIN